MVSKAMGLSTARIWLIPNLTGWQPGARMKRPRDQEKKLLGKTQGMFIYAKPLIGTKNPFKLDSKDE